MWGSGITAVDIQPGVDFVEPSRLDFALGVGALGYSSFAPQDPDEVCRFRYYDALEPSASLFWGFLFVVVIEGGGADAATSEDKTYCRLVRGANRCWVDTARQVPDGQALSAWAGGENVFEVFYRGVTLRAFRAVFVVAYIQPEFTYPEGVVDRSVEEGLYWSTDVGMSD